MNSTEYRKHLATLSQKELVAECMKLRRDKERLSGQVKQSSWAAAARRAAALGVNL